MKWTDMETAGRLYSLGGSTAAYFAHAEGMRLSGSHTTRPGGTLIFTIANERASLSKILDFVRPKRV